MDSRIRIRKVRSHGFTVERGFGLPMPREPAYAAKRSHDGEAQVAFE